MKKHINKREIDQDKNQTVSKCLHMCDKMADIR